MVYERYNDEETWSFNYLLISGSLGPHSGIFEVTRFNYLLISGGIPRIADGARAALPFQLSFDFWPQDWV